MKQEEVTSHFDVIAPQYDLYKKKNPHYTGFSNYRAIKKALKEIIPTEKKVFDFGCGTGEILAFLSPTLGIGYDISPKMVQIAQSKYKSKRNLGFVTSLNQISGTFDYILMVDVVEHLAEPRKAFASLKKFMNEDTYLIVSFVDSSWEPILWMLEKLGLKMPEGPHKRLLTNELIEIGEEAGLTCIKTQKVKIIEPIPFPLISLLTFKKK